MFNNQSKAKEIINYMQSSVIGYIEDASTEIMEAYGDALINGVEDGWLNDIFEDADITKGIYEGMIDLTMCIRYSDFISEIVSKYGIKGDIVKTIYPEIKFKDDVINHLKQIASCN